VQGISHAEFARRCGRSAKLIREIIVGKAPLEPETALQFEAVLRIDASIWLGIEADYQLRRARRAEAQEAAKSGDWLVMALSAQPERVMQSIDGAGCDRNAGP
jgi:HTH-type transcriptional regulator / antitoxin HigA